MRMRSIIGLSAALLIVAGAAWAKQPHTTHGHAAASVKAKHGRTVAAGVRSGAKQPTTPRRIALHRHKTPTNRRQLAHAEPRNRHSRSTLANLPLPDQYLGGLRAIGPAEIGKAAWYGGRRLGARTASGERLDAVHPTAAHRSLPLHSLVRITNLKNGRSAIAKINDRGPASRSLLIDLSPRVAQQLDMMRSGIARVAIVPVVAIDPAAR
jgi:rare lipoprotein A (peptidoglycan hydrolase)